MTFRNLSTFPNCKCTYPTSIGKKTLSQVFLISFFKEWGKDCPEFVAAYKLEHDMTFTPFDRITKREDEDKIIDKILKTNSNQLQLTFN